VTPNLALHPTAYSLRFGRSFRRFGFRRRVNFFVRRLMANTKMKGCRAESRGRKTVASGEQGVVQFPGSWREPQVVDVARSAYSQTWVAPEQANAPDREQRSS
jgi:hypothetical protein